MPKEELLESAVDVRDFPAEYAAIVAFPRSIEISEQALASILQVELLLQPGGIIAILHSHRSQTASQP